MKIINNTALSLIDIKKLIMNNNLKKSNKIILNINNKKYIIELYNNKYYVNYFKK